MSLKFNCPSAACRARIEVDDALAGTLMSCPVCGAALTVPTSHDIRFTCAGADCDQHIIVDVSEAGRAVKCPACSRPQRVPGAPPKPLVPEPVSEPDRSAWERLTDYKPLRRFKHEDQFVVWFFLAALGGLLILGMCKVATPWLKPGYPAGYDVVFGISLSVTMVILGILECAVVGVCAGVPSTRLAGWILLWYVGNWWVYRIGQMTMGQRQPLPALGAVGDMAGLRDLTTDRLMMLFSLNVAVGAAVIVWRQGRIEKDESAAKNRKTKSR